MACYAQENPLQIFKEFEALYTNQRYSEKLDPKEISFYIEKVLSQLFSADRAEFIA
jgi:hypothetical protein